jgi:hypothetical protein
VPSGRSKLTEPGCSSPATSPAIASVARTAPPSMSTFFGEKGSIVGAITTMRSSSSPSHANDSREKTQASAPAT